MFTISGLNTFVISDVNNAYIFILSYKDSQTFNSFVYAYVDSALILCRFKGFATPSVINAHNSENDIRKAVENDKRQSTCMF